MPKRLLFVLTVFAVVLANCNGSSSPSPTPEPTISFTPNPSITAAYVYVTFNGSPQPHIPVAMSTPLNSNTASPRPGTPFVTVTTRPLVSASPATAIFQKLRASQYYCWVATIPFPTPTPLPPSATPSPTPTPGGPSPSPTPSPIIASACAAPVNWQYTTIDLGT